MKNRYYILGFLAALMGVMVSLYSCTDELEGMGNASTRPTDVVCFTASLSDGRKASVSRGASGLLEIEQEEWLVGMEKKDGSRGAPVSLLKGSAGVIGYGDDNSVWSDNAEYEFDGDELTAMSSDVRWNTIAGNNSVSCYVYAPYTNSNISGKTISYQVPGTVRDQKDLIVASWTGTKGTNYGTKTEGDETVTIQPQTIPLTFEHALTAVKFKVGFPCKVTKLEIKGIFNSGTYTFGSGWSVLEGQTDYTFNFDENGSFSANAFLTDGDNTLMMIPQTLHGDAEVVLTTIDNGTIKIPLEGKVWQPGKMITYTIYKDPAPTTIYFDLAAGNVTIGSTYSGMVYVGGQEVVVTGNHQPGNRYYVYQSSTAEEFTKYNKANTGYENEADFNEKKNCRIPDYKPVEYQGQWWSDYITNNNDVNAIINAWYINNSSETAGKVGRTGIGNRIIVNAVANTSFDLVIDDIYSTFQTGDKTRKDGGISFSPGDKEECILKITTLGDNRLGNIHYYNKPKPETFVSSANITTQINKLGVEEYIETKNMSNGSQIIFEGTGSLTVTDVIAKQGHATGWNTDGFFGNYYCAAIGGNDNGDEEECMGIVINSGVLFAGSTASENCSAIGGGGNGFGEVTINGGTVTAVAATTGTAIGGGIGYSSHGGEGRVYIHGGNVYAYNLDNHRNIPSSAIGGAGSSSSTGTLGVVEITGGYVYAYSALGTAIGGGSSQTKVGGDAKVTITGGQVIAKSGRGAGIGGGSACTGGGDGDIDGGTAIINISGNPIIRTGSIGGGQTNATDGQIGSAKVEIGIGDSDIQAQFVMAAGAKTTPSFTMNGGTIRNSYVDVDGGEYIHIQNKGGAVYLEDGTFTMTGGTIKNCSAEQGGAVYIERKSTEPMDEDEFNFKMTGGEIHSCFATGNSSGTILGHGGAVCLNGGQVLMTGGTIQGNYSENGDGGAIYINNGNFTMRDDNFTDSSRPTISGNSAQKGNGGGVFVSSAGSGVQVNLLHGLITNNAASNYGGGVCVDMGVGTSYSASVMVGEERQGDEQNTNPDISGNTSLMSGGGLYVRGASANITINGGNIKGNSVSAYVKNENVANEGGMVTLNADNVTDIVTITFHDIDGSGNETVYTQKVVSNTNTNLQRCNEVINGKTFVRWNNRSDGNGTIEYKNGDKINISENITLYAIRKDQ